MKNNKVSNTDYKYKENHREYVADYKGVYFRKNEKYVARVLYIFQISTRFTDQNNIGY